MQIKKIHIENYRSFRDSGEQPITKLFALIGKNNTGKSAFISAIQSVLGDKKLSDLDIHKNNGNPIRITLVVEETNPAGEEPKQTEVICEFSGGDSKFWVGGGKELKRLPANFPKLLVIPAIRNPQEETTAGKDSFLKDLIAEIVDLKTKDVPKIEEIRGKTAETLNLNEIKSLLDYRTSAHLEGVEKTISEHLQASLEDNELSVAINPDGDLSKAVKYSTRIKEPHLGSLDGVDILNCGTGLQSMAIMALLQTYADLQNRKDSILLIEEPEVYLHPELQRKMFSVLRKIAKRTQVIYTTHSPIMIGDLWDDSVRLITRQNGETVISDIDVQGVVRELGIRYEDILNPKVVIFVEGPNDILFYSRIIEVMYPHLATKLDTNVKFIDTGGFETIHVYALMNILLSVNVTAKFYMIADSDGKTQEDRKNEICDKIRKRIRKHDFSVDKQKVDELPNLIRVLSQYAIESYLLVYELLRKLDEDLSKEDADYFVAHYNRCYSNILGKKGLDRLKQTMRPKLLFEDPNTEAQLIKVRKDFEEDARFLSIREQLVTAWKNKKTTGRSPLQCIVDQDTIKNPALQEPISLLKGIIETLEMHSPSKKSSEEVLK